MQLYDTWKDFILNHQLNKIFDSKLKQINNITSTSGDATANFQALTQNPPLVLLCKSPMIMTSLQPIMNHCILKGSLAQNEKYVGMTGFSDTGTIVAFHLEHFFSTSKKTPIPQVQCILLVESIDEVPEIKEIDQVKLSPSVILPQFIVKTIFDNILKTLKEMFWTVILAINGQSNECVNNVNNKTFIY